VSSGNTPSILGQCAIFRYRYEHTEKCVSISFSEIVQTWFGNSPGLQLQQQQQQLVTTNHRHYHRSDTIAKRSVTKLSLDD